MTDDTPSDEPRKVALNGVDALNIFGQRDHHLRAIERHFGVSLVLRNGEVIVFGSPPARDQAHQLVAHLVDRVRNGGTLTDSDLADYLAGRRGTDEEVDTEELVLHFERKSVQPRSPMQATYLRAIAENDIVFGIGPAGTGKTYLAVAMAVNALKERTVDRVILVRPAVEAGEKLGYLPGDLQDKVDPFLRPLYDALSEMISYDRLQKYLQTGVIEIVPLAFMRGRTLGRAFVIMDEAQNSTLPQMKMFLTRLGLGSQAVVTGDVTQIDLGSREDSGLVAIQPHPARHRRASVRVLLGDRRGSSSPS